MICCFRRTAHIAARLYIPVIWPAAVVFCFSQNSPFVNSFMDIHACRRFGMKVSSAKRFYVLNFTTVRNMQSRWPLRLQTLYGGNILWSLILLHVCRFLQRGDGSADITRRRCLQSKQRCICTCLTRLR